MASIHILVGHGNNNYTAVVHATVPAGNNAAGIAWTVALANSGLAQPSIMTVGTGPGQISNAENNTLLNGTLIEAIVPWTNDPNWTAAQRNADLDLRAQQAINEKLADLQVKLRLFGATRT